MSGEDSNDSRNLSPDSSSRKDSEDSLQQLVVEILQQFPLGISEYDLIKAIQATGHLHFRQVEMWDKLSLFQTHFLLFHTLYSLRQELWQQRRYVLEINPLKIILFPWNDTAVSVAQNEITEHDPLQDYYLDINNLEQISAEDVNNLLASFWIRLAADEQRTEALKVLELKDPVDYPTIKKQYRRLAMLHHPDRGGDHIKLQTLNAAMDILQKCEIKKVLK